MARQETITPKMLESWASEISIIADTLCEDGEWTKEEWYTLYNHASIQASLTFRPCPSVYGGEDGEGRIPLYRMGGRDVDP